MKLATHITSERGKEVIKTGNDFIYQEFTVKKVQVGQIELYLNHDIDNYGDDEWLLKYRKDDNEDWTIIAQGNI